MKSYKEVKIECYTYKDLLEIYERKYKQEYQLIGYRHKAIEGVGTLVMYPWEEKTNEK